MGKSGPSGTTTVTSNSAPWAGQQPYLVRGFADANNLLNSGGPQYYPGQTIATPSQDTTNAQNLIAQRAVYGSPVTQAADNLVTGTENGSYLKAGNPYFQNLVGQISASLQPRVDSTYENAGRYGSGAAANAFASALTNETGNLAFQNYNNERQNQLKASALAPSLANQDFADLGQLANVGQRQDQQAQNQINAGINRYNYNQQLPYNNLSNYLRLIQGNYGSSQTQTQPYFAAPLGNTASGVSNLLGLGNTAASLLSLF